jgi:hypothetical protein
VDRKTVRRYVAAAVACGLDLAGGEGQLGDELLGRVAERARPHRAGWHGDSWALLAAHHDQFRDMLDDQGLTAVKAGELLARQGIVVPERTLHRYALQVLGHGRGARRATVRVTDCEPGAECQVDFGRMGLLDDPGTGRRRVVHALIFTAVYSPAARRPGPGRYPVSPPAPAVSPELRSLLRQVKLGQLTPALPERLALAPVIKVMVTNPSITGRSLGPVARGIARYGL